MNQLIDLKCPLCSHVIIDVWVESSAPRPTCNRCHVFMMRAWFVAPGITPRGTRPERNADRLTAPQRVDVKAMAEATKLEIEQKWLRYSNEQVAEQHISREINEAAGISDAAGNEIPIPTPAPIVFAKPTASACTH